VLLRDKTRQPGRAPLSPQIIAKILALPCGPAPKDATHWTGRMVAKATGVSLSAVQRIWQAHRLQPHRIRTFKKSNDPAFAAKVEDIVGLYMTRPLTPWSSLSMKKARFRRSTAASQVCR
jgi:hypothetical protein